MSAPATTVTVLGHACVLIEVQHEGRQVRLLLDPGNLTPPLTDLGPVDAVLITHDHPDHFDPEQVGRVVSAAPLQVYGPEALGARLAEAGHPFTALSEGEFEVDGVRIEVVRTSHETLYPGVPLPDNFGLLVGGVFAPGDALSAPDREIEVLLAPLAGPWMKLSEGIDFVREVGPEVVIPIHDGGLGAAHRGLHRSLLRTFVPDSTVLRALEPGESLTI